MDNSKEQSQNGPEKVSSPKKQSRPEPKEVEDAKNDLTFETYNPDADNEMEADDYDPCLGYDSDEEDEGEEEEEEELPEYPTSQGRASSAKEAAPITEQPKKFRRHHFIKHEICFPDKKGKYRSAPKGKPWYLIHKTGALERRQDSSIAFVMPRQEDPHVLALRRTNKMIHKLIKYMKKSWKIRVDRKQQDRELEHRLLTSVYTQKSDDWFDLIRARENRALETGFFSPMDRPYDDLINLELDTALLTFKNLPPDLKITAGRWIRENFRKEELKRKRDANLPRLPHGKVKRPSYNKGRLIKDPGGVRKVDEFARVAEGFVKVASGNTPFSKVLKVWSQNKEKENYNLNSGFGVLREGMFDFSKSRASAGIRNNSNEEDDFQKGGSDQRRVSIVDARKYQRDMLYFEKMLSAMFDLVKSLLNIKTKQLESKFPLPPTAVLQIRGRSPERSSRKEKPPLLVTQRQGGGSKNSRAPIVEFGHEEEIARKETTDRGTDDLLRLASVGKKQAVPKPVRGGSMRKSLANWVEGQEQRLSTISAHQIAISQTEIRADANVNDITTARPVSSKQLVKDIKHQHAYEDFMDIRAKRQTMLTAEQKIKRLAEHPDHAAIRRARNYMTYTKLFERNRKIKRPVWHNVDVAQLSAELDAVKGLDGKDPANLTEADAAEVVDQALKKRKKMKNSTAEEVDEAAKRWPDEFDIPTPTFQFTQSKMKISSEEQSRLNLLKKTPHMNEIPSTPIRRLFKLSGVRTTEKDVSSNILEMKKMFRLTENKLRVYYENEIGKLDWDTMKRFRGKLSRVKSTPVYQWTISLMRLYDQEEEDLASTDSATKIEDEEETKQKQRRPALWYKKLHEECDMNGATRHNGCQTELEKLMKYCDVDMKTKPHMLNRLALLVVSLPTTELGTRHWQQAVVFLLEHMCGTPPEMIHLWLIYRGIPYLL